MNEAIVSCDPRLKTWMNLFSSLHRCLRPFHPVWMEPARVRIAEHQNLDYAEVMSRRNIYRVCYLISFFCPFIGHFIQQKPFHSLIRRHLIRSVCCRTEECRIYCMNIEYVWVYTVTLFAFSELSWMGCGCILRYSEMEQFGSKWKYNNFMFLVLTLKTP